MSSAAASTQCWVRAPLDQTWDLTTRADAARFYPKYGPLPAVERVDEVSGTWDHPGPSRRLHLSDGSTVVETLTIVERPALFVYELSGFTKLLGKLVSGARAEWTFTERGPGIDIDWTYTFFPLPWRSAAVLAIVKIWWAPYMRQVLPVIAQHVRESVAAGAAEHGEPPQNGQNPPE